MKKNQRVTLALTLTDESSNNYSDKCDVTFYRWQTLQKRITKSKIDVPLNEAIYMFKEDLITLKENI